MFPRHLLVALFVLLPTLFGALRAEDAPLSPASLDLNIVELSGGRIAMIIRADQLGGRLFTAVSKDGGKTWPEFASVTEVPNPGSKATLYPLGGDCVAGSEIT